MLDYFGESIGRMVAIDASPGMVRRAKSRFPSGVKGPCIVLGDVNRLPFRENALGGIICIFSLTTVNSPENALQEFERTLMAGSKLIILDNERPRGLLARILYPALVPISRLFCHTHIDRDIAGLLSNARGLEETDPEPFLGGLVCLREGRKSQIREQIIEVD